MATKSLDTYPYSFEVSDTREFEEFSVILCALGVKEESSCTSPEMRNAYKLHKKGHVVIYLGISDHTDHVFVIQQSNSEYFVWQSYLDEYTFSDYLQFGAFKAMPFDLAEIGIFLRELRYIIFPALFKIKVARYQEYYKRWFHVRNENNIRVTREHRYVLNSEYSFVVAEFSEDACDNIFGNDNSTDSYYQSKEVTWLRDLVNKDHLAITKTASRKRKY